MTFRLRRGDRRLTRRNSARLTIALTLCALAPLAGAATAEAAPTVSVSDVSLNEATGTTTTATFTISLSEPSLMAVSVDAATLTGTAGSADFGRRTATTVTFLPGQTSKTFNVTVLGDSVDEETENFFVQLSNPSAGVAVNDAFGEAQIADDDAPSAISINDVSLNEPGASYANATFTVSLNRASEKPISVRVDTTPGTADGADYSSRSDVTVLFPVGVTSRTVSVPVRPGDAIDENDETFHLDASNAINAAIADGRGTATIVDDDPAPTISVNDVSVTEGDSAYVNATFTVSLSQKSSRSVTVVANTAPGTAGAQDYSSRSNVLVSFPAGTTSRAVSVPVRPDSMDEFDETFSLNLSSPGNATIADGSGTGTIVDNDAPPLVSIGDVTVVEPFTGETSARVAVTLSAPSGKPVTVQHATSGGTATAGVDYQARNNSVTIPAGKTSTTTGVDVFADNFREPDETFNRVLSGATNATIDDAFGLTTISANCYDKEPNSAAGAMDIGSIAGDFGAEQVASPAGASICSGDTDWFKVQLRETDGPNSLFLSAQVSLEVADIPMNGDLDLFVYDSDGTTLFDSSESTGTADEGVYYWYDDTAADDTHYFYVAVVGFPDPATNAPAVNDYTLRVTGNQ